MTVLVEDDWKERREPRKTRDNDVREYHDIDYARIIHSASFRRLQGKTQIFTLGANDFYRTRLTHSIEVSQIAGCILQQLEGKVNNDPVFDELKRVLPSQKLIAAIAAAHDLGHPPFGHGGEVALNYCMKDHAGFEGNGQTLRILSKLEHYSENAGANLARRTLLGCLKYPVEFSKVENECMKPRLIDDKSMPVLIDRKISKPPKCYLNTEERVVQWILAPLSNEDKKTFQEIEKDLGKHNEAKHRSLDCSIVNLADDISYGVHDLEDAVTLNLLNEKNFKHYCDNLNESSLTRYDEAIGYKNIVKKISGPNAKQYVGCLVNYFVTNIEIETIDDFTEPLLKYRVKLKEEARELLDSLIELVRKEVIFSPNVQQLEFKGQRMVIEVFDILKSDPEKYLREGSVERLKKKSDEKERIICDYIAGMTDDYLLKTYERLSSPRMGSVLDIF